MSDPRRQLAVEVVRTLREAGFQALFAGGCVRDELLGQPPTDYDVATDATPDRVMALFRRTVPVGVSFGVVRVLGPKDAGEVEVATFRSDGQYLDGRRPESVTFGTAEADASRRDFTINGMFLDPIEGTVIDYVGGREDLDRRLIRAIGAPHARFEEDKLRLLRAVRISSRFGFEIEPETAARSWRCPRRSGRWRRNGSRRNFKKMLVHQSRSRAMNLAMETGLVAAILRRFAADEGAEAGQARPARRRPLGPHDDGPRGPARAELPAGDGRPAPRRRQAADEGPPRRADDLLQSRVRRGGGWRSGSRRS